MTYTPIPHGTLDWDVPLNSTLADQDARITAVENAEAQDINDWMPADQNLVAWTYDPLMGTSGGASTSGQIILSMFSMHTAAMVSNVIIGVTTAQVGGVAGQNFIGIYDINGNLVVQTADITSSINSTGNKTIPLSIPTVLPVGRYWAALLTNAATTQVATFRNSATGTMNNAGTTTSTRRAATFGTGLTALPSNIPPTSMASFGSTQCFLFS